MMRKRIPVFIAIAWLANLAWSGVPFYVMGFWNGLGEEGYEFSAVWDHGGHLLADEPAYEYLVEQEVVYLTNLERAKQGLLPLKRNELLDVSARLHAEDMRDQDYFNHTSPDGKTPDERIRATGYDAWWSGENIAAGYESATKVLEGWMNSEGHRENILRPEFREIGAGFAMGGGTYERYWVQNFGSRHNIYPVVIENELYETTERVVQLAVYGEEKATSIRVSNYSDFLGATWQTFQSTLSWELLPGNGTRTVYVEIKTEGGVSFPAQSDSIELTGQPESASTPTPTTVPTSTPTVTPTLTPTPPMVSTAIPGDINYDGVVDVEDLWILQAHWHRGQRFTPTPTPTFKTAPQ